MDAWDPFKLQLASSVSQRAWTAVAVSEWKVTWSSGGCSIGTDAGLAGAGGYKHREGSGQLWVSTEMGAGKEELERVSASWL